MRKTPLAFACALLASTLLAAGCGGGGGAGGGSSAATVSVAGAVVTVDGSTSNLGGVAITDTSTGTTFTTDASGAFDLGEVAPGTLNLCVGRGAPGTDVADLPAGETVRVHLRVRAGLIEAADACVGRGDDRDAEFRLERSVSSDDRDVTGEGRIASHPAGDGIGVLARHLDVGREVEWFVITPDAVAESEGTTTASDGGNAWWRLTSEHGGRLPFAVASVAALEGYGVEIRDATAGTVLLVGTIPALPVPVVGGGDPHGPPDCTDAHGRALLPAATGVAGEAHVGIESRTGDEPRESFEVDVEARDAGTAFAVWLEDPATPGTLVQIGTLTVGAEHVGVFVLSTRLGDTLPFGVTTVSALVGLAVEVRDASNAVAFAGHVPALVGP